MEESLVANREEKRWQHHEESKKMRLVRKQIKRNRSPKPARRRDWMPNALGDPDAADDLSLPASERVMPHGERERRQTVMHDALTGWQNKGAQKRIGPKRVPQRSVEPSWRSAPVCAGCRRKIRSWCVTCEAHSLPRTQDSPI